MRLLGLLLLLTAGAASAGEYALLASGARMRVDRHEIEGARIRLYNSTGYIEMQASNVTGFEAEVLPPSVPVTAPPGPVIAPPPATSPAPSPTELADAAADKYGLPRPLVRIVMAAESGFHAGAVSPKGAIGLMQLMPATAQNLGADPYDPAQNVDAGVRYLSDLLIRYHRSLWRALAAYNAGPDAVDKYHGVPPYAETINYVNRIDKAYKAGDTAAPGEQQR